LLSRFHRAIRDLEKAQPDERAAYEGLWADVAALVKKAGEDSRRPGGDALGLFGPNETRASPFLRQASARRGCGPGRVLDRLQAAHTDIL
jgi:hypothetical protein